MAGPDTPSGILSPDPAWLEERLGLAPWAQADRFLREIDPGQMAESATVYARAASDASGAADLARLATERTGEAGALDGDPLADLGQRVRDTSRDLQGDGRGLADVVGLLVKAMNLAVDTEKKVYRIVYGEGGLDETFRAARQRALENPDAGGTADPAGTDRWTATEDRLVDELRYPVTTAHGELDVAIRGYEHTLTGYGAELLRLGHPLTEGPLNLWTTGTMAERAARSIREELIGKADTARLADHTAVLEEIVGHALRLPEGERLSAAESAYLAEFFRQLGEDGVVSLGRLEPDATALSPGAAALDRAAVRNVANGWNVLNSDRLHPDAPLDAWFEPYLLTDDQVEASGDTVERLNAMGTVLAEATVPPGAIWAEETARSAVGAQRDWQERVAGGDGTWPPVLTGAGDVLLNAARNPEAATALLGDGPFRDALLSRTWPDATGAARLISAGTLTDTAGERTFPLLDAADAHADAVAGEPARDWPGHADHTALQDVLAALRDRHGLT
jgi:hypothetical protein